jgi:hypothetical protein
MRRTGYIFLVVFICGAVILVIHRKRQVVMHDRQLISANVDDSPNDVAATLRMLSASQVNDESKGWATRFVDFVNDHPGRQWIVGTCDKPCLSEAEAASSARADAARKLYPIMARRVNARGTDATMLQQLVWNDVQNNRFESDRFAEQFSRPYGKVWTESVLLDVSPDRIQPLVDQYRHQGNVQHIQLRRRAGLGGFVIAATALLYLFLNSVTRGYFTFRLRLAAMVIVAAVLILIV